jgi:transcriptional regulator with XRE-family HTH domain
MRCLGASERVTLTVTRRTGVISSVVGAGWVRVGQRIHAERARRWSTREAFADATGLSVRVLLDLENARRERYRPSTLSAVEAALGWSAGSIERAAAGGRPEREADRELQQVLDAWPMLSQRDREAVLSLVTSLLRQ